MFKINNEVRNAYVDEMEVCISTLYDKYFGRIIRYDPDTIDIRLDGTHHVNIPCDMIETFSSR